MTVNGMLVQTIVAADGDTVSGLTGDNEGYNASANSWSSLAADPHPRNAACTGPLGGRLFVAGGNNGGALSVTESFNLFEEQMDDIGFFTASRG
jgi:hypothetical protein